MIYKSDNSYRNYDAANVDADIPTINFFDLTMIYLFVNLKLIG